MNTFMNTKMVIAIGSYLTALKELRIIRDEQYPHTSVTEEMISFETIIIAGPDNKVQEMIKQGLEEITNEFGATVSIKPISCGIRVAIKK